MQKVKRPISTLQDTFKINPDCNCMRSDKSNSYPYNTPNSTFVTFCEKKNIYCKNLCELTCIQFSQLCLVNWSVKRPPVSINTLHKPHRRSWMCSQGTHYSLLASVHKDGRSKTDVMMSLMPFPIEDLES